MHPRHRTLVLLALPLALFGCKFDATGLGADGSGGATTTTSVTSTGAAPTDTTTGVGPGVTPTNDPPTASGSGSASDSATTTASVATDTSGEPPKPICGDGQVSGDETCDDGSDNGPTKPCTSACAANVCGDGFPLAGDEACDDGNDDDDDGCRNDCSLPPGCGNSKIDDGEQCDDGNLVDSDGCIACKKAACGDGYVQQNVESCDGGIETSECNADCSLAMCGDLKFNPSAGEVCDLGAKNGIYDSGCAADCKGPGPTCGDGMVDAPDEKCEAAIPPPNSTCNADCQTISCADHHADCDQNVATGCEINIDDDKNNCGECGKKCLVDCTDGGCSL